MLDDDCQKGRHTLTAWLTVFEPLGNGIQCVTFLRYCTLCSYREDARRDPVAA